MKKLLISVAVALVVSASAAPAFAGGNLSPAEDQQLQMLMNKKLVKLFGNLPPDYTGYLGDAPGHQALPPGCVEQKKHDVATHHTYVIVTCPMGSGPGPGPLKPGHY